MILNALFKVFFWLLVSICIAWVIVLCCGAFWSFTQSIK